MASNFTWKRRLFQCRSQSRIPNHSPGNRVGYTSTIKASCYLLYKSIKSVLIYICVTVLGEIKSMLNDLLSITSRYIRASSQFHYQEMPGNAVNIVLVHALSAQPVVCCWYSPYSSIAHDERLSTFLNWWRDFTFLMQQK